MATVQYFSVATRNMISQVRERYPHLTRDKENALINLWRLEGSVKAKDTLVLGHMDLMIKMVYRLLGYGIPADDLLGQAVNGMQRALGGYDPSRGFRLGTFARAWIQESMLSYIQTNIKMTKGPNTAAAKTMFYHLGRLRKELGILGTASEQDAVKIRERLMLTLPSAETLTVKSIMDSDSYLLSLFVSADAPGGGGDSTTTILEYLPSDDEPVDCLLVEHDEAKMRSDMLHKAMKVLNPRQIDILTQRKLVEPCMTLEQLGDKYSVSRERVRQIEERAIAMVAAAMHALTKEREMVAQEKVITRALEVAKSRIIRPSWSGTKALKGISNPISTVRVRVPVSHPYSKMGLTDEELRMRRSMVTLKGNMSRTPEQRRLISIKSAETVRRKRTEAVLNGTAMPSVAYSKMALSKEEVRMRRSVAAQRANMSRTPEQRRLITLKGNMSRTPEQRSLISIKAAETVRMRKQISLSN